VERIAVARRRSLAPHFVERLASSSDHERRLHPPELTIAAWRPR
jgi:hypothetical protein